MALHQVSEDYLRSVSPLARRISEDLIAARDAYQDLWDTLDDNEKNQVLDEALIDPAIVLKYASRNDNNWSVEPLSQFSWFTKSQLNLCSHLKADKTKTPVKRQAPAPPVETASPTRNGTPPEGVDTVDAPAKPPPPPAPEPTNLLGKLKNKVMKQTSLTGTGEEKQGLVEPKPNVSIVAKVVAKPKTPPPPPPTGLVPNERKALLSHQEDDIPKTGFDFLDNW